MVLDFAEQLEQTVQEMVRAELRRLGILGRDEKSPLSSEESLLTTAEAASWARVSQGTIRRWIRENRLQRYEAGTHIRVRRSELEAIVRPGRRARNLSLSVDTSGEALAERILRAARSRSVYP